MPNCVIPLSKKMVDAIIHGDAHVLPRRVMPRRVCEGERLLFYHGGLLHGIAVVRGRHDATGINLWAISQAAGMSDYELIEYWAGARKPGYFVLGDICAFNPPRPWGSLTPLQNFIYV